MAVWIEEFLFRGKDPDSGQKPAWHVVLASKVDDGFGGTQILTRMMGVAEAEAAGYPLVSLIATMNAETLKTSDSLSTQLKTAQQSLTDITTERDGLSEQVLSLAAENAALKAPKEVPEPALAEAPAVAIK